MRTIELYINSNIDRLVQENASTSKSFTTLLNGSKRIQILPSERKASFKLSGVEVPNVSYNFPEIESRFYVIVYDASNNPETIEFVQLDPNRVYATPLDLINFLNTELTTHPNAVCQDLVLSYSDLTKKVSITNNSARRVRLISSYRYPNENAEGLGISSVINDMMDRLGFADDYTNTIILPTESLTGNGTIRMLFTNCYYLALKELSTSYEQSIIPDPTILSKRILARITTGNFGTLSQLQFASNVSMSVDGNQIIDRLSFELLDQEFRPVDLVNHPITFSLEVSLE